ncbi:NAD-dependent succinate-semialdehyde dehydrogenase [Solirubrobacter phytolaccae]|uniref:NAD-dependent succinate-semialdehyde dehydrogenase n=1 Tax=Solirubrobacter phytolaccae TaxID=1404360 RepID=A0A9X3S731_9ACTN|nr:NAD-dependent succinate-semialdehyde dehydrogenase [Solirubrobacter phytolaccae]MDA0179823.1 NAD-dependent succinate-semialdehyde dehydrogenase [Solirubrobacter phytolaccae]
MSATTYAVVNPATGETVKTYETISDDALKDAIGRAHDAHEGWGRGTSVEERAKIIARVAELHNERQDELAEIIVREMGKPIEQARGEVEFSAAIYQYYADNGPKLLADEPIELLEGDGSAFIRRSSVGLLLGIMPWNYPYYQVARFAGPNLVTGNTILLKHAPQCPESAAVMEEIFHAAGVPKDAYINVYATNEQIEWVIGDRRVQGVSLTGSGRAGAAVAEIAGRNLKKVVLELGGSDPFIVLKADDLDAVVEQAVGGRLENSGQACNAAKRFIVLEDLYDGFVEKFTAALTGVQPGDPTSKDTTVGPLSSTAAADRLESQVKEALDNGAELAAGGGRDGNFFKTAVLTGITKDNPAYTEEFFGPVAQVYKVGSEAEAIALANDTPYGLGSYVFTTDDEQALRVADQIEAGMVFINAVGAEGVELPFGGVKASGFGRELGRFGADEFVNKKMIRVG